MKVIFMGTPQFALPSLRAIAQSHHQVVAVVSQPDKPVGRSNKPVPTPVKALATELNIPVLQFDKISRDGVQALCALNADVMVTCAYGQILSQEVLDITPNGVINVHGSLLPKYRGAAPIQWAIINGDTTTGITILRSMAGMDDGPILFTQPMDIKPYETSEQLFDRLSVLGAECIVKALDMIESGKATFTPQDEAQAVKCRMLKPTMSYIDYTLPASQVANLINGLNPWPVVKCTINGVHFKLWHARVVDGYNNYEPATVACSDRKVGLVIKCGDKAVLVDEMQAEGGKRMSSCAYLNGKSIAVGNKVISE